MMRYQVTATTPPPVANEPEEWRKLDTPEEKDKFLKRALNCEFFGNLQDIDGFKLVKFDIAFRREVDDKGLVDALASNDAIPLSAQMYRDALKGTFIITWKCQ